MSGRPGWATVLWAPRRLTWWIAVLFAAGSACFLVAPFPAFLRLVGPQADGAVFFVGSLLLTILILVRHRSNMMRMLKGTEPRIGEKVEGSPTARNHG